MNARAPWKWVVVAALIVAGSFFMVPIVNEHFWFGSYYDCGTFLYQVSIFVPGIVSHVPERHPLSRLALHMAAIAL